MSVCAAPIIGDGDHAIEAVPVQKTVATDGHTYAPDTSFSFREMCIRDRYKALFASNKYERKIITQTDPESGARDGSFWSEMCIRDRFDTALMRTFNVISKREECIRTERYIGQLIQPCPFFFAGEYVWFYYGEF